MTEEIPVVGNTTPLAMLEDASPENGAEPDPVLNTGEKAIKLVELQKDLNELQSQALAISGAVQYIQQKIAKLSRVEEVKE